MIRTRTFKMILGILTLTLILSSCESATQQEAQEYADKTFKEIEYKGHSYIMFFYVEGYSGFAGLEHNPECPCYKKGGEDDLYEH